MKTEDIILIENNAGGEIHLVKDRLFWQAWERSAFLFVHNFKNYKVHHRFVQKVMQDFVWLGFPEKAFGAIFATAKSKNFVVKNISEYNYSPLPSVLTSLASMYCHIGYILGPGCLKTAKRPLSIQTTTGLNRSQESIVTKECLST